MLIAEKVLLLLVISLTAEAIMGYSIDLAKSAAMFFAHVQPCNIF